MTEKREFKSRIDTIQTLEDASNRVDLNLEIKGIKQGFSRIGKWETKWNVNNMRYEYSNEYKLSVTKAKLEELMDIATVVNVDDVKMNRIDICTDSTINFVENSKLIYLLHKCLTMKIKNGKAWNNEDDDDFNYSNFRFKNRDWNVEFYDKDKESEGKSLYNTRFEVRHLRVKNQEFEYHIDKTIDLWRGALNNLEVVEKIQIEKLCSIWDKEKVECPKMKFTTFVDRYHAKFLTKEILKEVYNYANLKGSLNGWLRDYRKTHILELATKTELDKIIKEVVKSLKVYKKL